MTAPLPHLVVRADAGPAVGAGHVMRCLALAAEWRRRGGAVTLLAAAVPHGVRARWDALGARVASITAAHPDPRDLTETLGALAAAGADGIQPWLLLDGYGFGPEYQTGVRAAGERLVVMDDTHHHPRYHATVLLNQNLGAERIPYLADEDTVLLLGSRFVLLRPEFPRRSRGGDRPAAEVARRVLVTLGGADAGNVTGAVLEALQTMSVPGLEVTVLVGGSNPHLDALRLAADRSRVPVRLVCDADDVSEWMEWADVAVSAAGSTCWELAHMGVPAVLLVTADNQRGVAAALEEAGFADVAGEFPGDRVARVAELLQALCLAPEVRAVRSALGRRLVDGAGPARVAEVLSGMDCTPGDLQRRLLIRRMSPEDVVALWHLANAPSVRRFAFSPDGIPFEAHTRWFADRLASADSVLYVAELGGAMAATVRYDRRSADFAELSFAVAGAFRGKGLGPWILGETFEAAREALGVTRLTGVAFAENPASVRAMEKAGYREVAREPINGRDCVVVERCG